MRYSEKEVAAAAAKTCLEILQTCRPGFEICGPLQQMFRDSADVYQVALPDNIEQLMGSPDQYGVDEMLDASSRLHYSQPSEQIGQYVDMNIGAEWGPEWQSLIVGRPRQRKTSGIGGRMLIDDMLNN